MAGIPLWRRSTRIDGEAQGAIYRERAAHLEAIADAEADPILREQLHDLARQYDEIAGSTVLRRETLDRMQREISRQVAAEPHIDRTASNEKPGRNPMHAGPFRV